MVKNNGTRLVPAAEVKIGDILLGVATAMGGAEFGRGYRVDHQDGLLVKGEEVDAVTFQEIPLHCFRFSLDAEAEYMVA